MNGKGLGPPGAGPVTALGTLDIPAGTSSGQSTEISVCSKEKQERRGHRVGSKTNRGQKAGRCLRAGNWKASARFWRPRAPRWGWLHRCGESESVSRSVVSGSLPPCGLQPARLLCLRDSPGKNTGVGCHCLLQGTFPTLALNLGS